MWGMNFLLPALTHTHSHEENIRKGPKGNKKYRGCCRCAARRLLCWFGQFRGEKIIFIVRAAKEENATAAAAAHIN
jgi:hypothetical protein